jgi:glycosyltransferase involved in cell wall biosynthesis
MRPNLDHLQKPAQPLVSVMMPAYNAEKYIAEAIESVIAQSYSNWELLVINDGSKDRTGEIAAQFTDPRIRLIHQENAGEAAARNTALAHMRGEYVAFLDADDAYLPDHLQLTVGYLLEHPSRDGVYTDGYHIDPQGRRLKSLAARRRGPYEGWVFEKIVLASDMFGPPLCIVVKRDSISLRNLTFDTEIVIGPDWEFFTRFCETTQFGYIDQKTCLYRIHATNISLTTDSQRRLLYLARCREKAIKLQHFGRCSPETRTAVFYDLLVNLLTGLPERQAEAIGWPEFSQLPVEEQGRLYRLTASKAIEKRVDTPYIEEWLRSAHQLNPKDRRAAFLFRLYHISPRVLEWLLRLKAWWEEEDEDEKRRASPFKDLEPE